MLFLLSLEKKKERRGKIVHILRRLRANLLVRVKIIKLRHVDYPEINLSCSTLSNAHVMRLFIQSEGITSSRDFGS